MQCSMVRLAVNHDPGNQKRTNWPHLKNAVQNED